MSISLLAMLVLLGLVTMVAKLGSSCSTVVDTRLQSKTLDVIASIPARCWAFSALLYLPLSSVSILRTLKEVKH